MSNTSILIIFKQRKNNPLSIERGLSTITFLSSYRIAPVGISTSVQSHWLLGVIGPFPPPLWIRDYAITSVSTFNINFNIDDNMML